MGNSIFEQAKSMISSRAFIESNFSSPGAYWQNGNYVTLSPLRPDGEIGSFSICEDGKFYDFADGSKGDVLDLLAAIEGSTPFEVAKSIAGSSSTTQATRQSVVAKPDIVKEDTKSSEGFDPDNKPEKKIKADWKPIPEGSIPSFAIQPDYLTLYCTDKGEWHYYIARWNATDGRKKKEIVPFYWSGNRFEKGLPPNLEQRNFVNFDRDKTVVVLEGEAKCQDASSLNLPNYSFTCWHGGAQVAQKVAIQNLRGCDVILWPDNDDVGKAAMNTIAVNIASIASKVRVVKIPSNVPKGWDIADAIKDNHDISVILASSEDFTQEAFYDDDEQPVGQTNGRPFTDLGNAERFLDLYGRDLRYSVEKLKWLIWNGNYWNDNDQSRIMSKVKFTIRSIAQAGDAQSMFHAKSSESSGSINSLLSLASKHRGVAVHEDELDNIAHIVMAPNGAINLKTGELEEPKRDYLCSKTINVPYGKSAECTRFIQFMNEIFQGRTKVIEVMQRWFGYSLTSDVSAQSFMIMHGNGSNGKSTLVELMLRIMGDYAKTAPPDMFIVKSGSSIPNDIAYLRGVRMVLTSETGANSRLAENKIKALTGGDQVTARYMRGEFFQFSPTWKISIATNHKPRIIGSDYGIWRRIILIPFNFSAVGDAVDPLLPQKLWAEREGILRWIVEGAVKWYADGGGRKGLAVPEEILTETQEYRCDEDILGRFVSDECYTGKEAVDRVGNNGFEATALYKTFVSWAEDQGEKGAAGITQNSFSRVMSEKGYKTRRDRKGKRVYDGIVPKGACSV